MKERKASVSPDLYVGVGLATFAIIALAVMWYSIDIFLLIFAGILFAIFLRSMSNVLTKYLHISDGAAVLLTLLALASVVTLSIVLLIPTTSDQLAELMHKLPAAWSQLKQNAKAFLQWQSTSAIAPDIKDLLPKSQNILLKATTFFSTTFGAIGSFLVVIFIGIFFAYDPEVYKNGLLKLLPIHKRARVAEVMDKVADTLQWWLIGKFVGMAFIGILTAAGLWLLEVPLAATLGLIAALFTFIPTFGPFLAAIPAVLIGASQDSDTALYVIFLYGGIQTLESYLLTPKIQQETISLPPALAIIAQILMMVLLGGLGLALAAPLTAALIVLIKMLYVEDVLHDDGKLRVES